MVPTSVSIYEFQFHFCSRGSPEVGHISSRLVKYPSLDSLETTSEAMCSMVKGNCQSLVNGRFSTHLKQ
eukprot:3861505-Amphidinium_carterae.1